MKKNKKAQIQNMETIAVVIIVIILIVMGIVYASSQKRNSLEKEREKTKDLDAMVISTNALNMDFLKCGEAGAIIETCVDYYSTKALETIIKKEENYIHFYNLFQDSKIELKILKNITDNDETNENIILYEAQNMENKTAILIRTPMMVKDPVHKINYFGIMEVTAYR